MMQTSVITFARLFVLSFSNIVSGRAHLLLSIHAWSRGSSAVSRCSQSIETEQGCLFRHAHVAEYH